MRTIKHREIYENAQGEIVRQDMVIECACGAHVELSDAWTNSCPRCVAEYNGGGQRLAPREQWGYETGESIADILSGRPE